jgi:DNA-binding IclR family transcriptional regulator
MPATNDGAGVAPRRPRPSREPLRNYQAMRTLQALERLAFAPLSAPELAASLQTSQRTARRLLRRLEAERYVALAEDARRRYRLTHRLAAIGRQAMAHDPLARTAASWVAELATATDRVATLWLPCYADVVCVPHAEPLGPAPQPMLGALVPAQASAPGKALLAHREAWRDSLLAQPLQRHTAGTSRTRATCGPTSVASARAATPPTPANTTPTSTPSPHRSSSPTRPSPPRPSP